MLIHGLRFTMYPSGDTAILEARADGGWNILKDIGTTFWNVPEDEVQRLLDLDRQYYRKGTDAPSRS